VTLARESVEMLSLEPVAVLLLVIVATLVQQLVVTLVLVVVALRVLEFGLPAMLTMVIVPTWRHRLAPIQGNKTDLSKSVHATVDGSNRNVPYRLPLAVRFDHSEKDHA
jgi:hypothetical protein